METDGWGARLLELEDEDGQWAGGSHFPAGFKWPPRETFQGPGKPWLGDGQPWTSTSHVLSLLRELGLEPESERAQRSVALIDANCRWDYDQLPYWGGEVEPCINGTLIANGSYFGVDMAPVVDRLVGESVEDGGWNCAAEDGSVRSSFNTTINVLEGLLASEQATGGTPESIAARRAGQEFLLARHLFKRLSTGEPADPRFLQLTHPSRWFYDVLRGLDYFREADNPDARLVEAIAYLRSRQREDGRWDLDWNPEGLRWFEIDDPVGQPNKWVTLRAIRVLDWWERSETAPPSG